MGTGGGRLCSFVGCCVGLAAQAGYYMCVGSLNRIV
jgi:hypothetical protein